MWLGEKSRYYSEAGYYFKRFPQKQSKHSLCNTASFLSRMELTSSFMFQRLEIQFSCSLTCNENKLQSNIIFVDMNFRVLHRNDEEADGILMVDYGAENQWNIFYFIS